MLKKAVYQIRSPNLKVSKSQFKTWLNRHNRSWERQWSSSHMKNHTHSKLWRLNNKLRKKLNQTSCKNKMILIHEKINSMSSCRRKLNKEIILKNKSLIQIKNFKRFKWITSMIRLNWYQINHQQQCYLKTRLKYLNRKLTKMFQR